jgi:hypothetical protein
MKAHIRVGSESGLVPDVECTAANVADVTQLHKLLHGQEIAYVTTAATPAPTIVGSCRLLALPSGSLRSLRNYVQ